jgi:hypothetical protein
LHIS